MAVTILVSLVVAITFVPGSLAILGRTVFWPDRPSGSAGSRARSDPPRSAIVNTITRRRGAVTVLLVGGVAMVAVATPVRHLDLGFGVISSLPASYEARRGAEHAAQGFLPGILSPTVVLVERPGLTDRREALVQLQRFLQARQGVSVVAGPGNVPSALTLGAVLSTSGDAARYLLVFSSDPLGAAAIDSLRALREDMPSLLARAGIPDAAVSFAGDTALAEVTVTQTEADLGRVVLVATGLGFVLLVSSSGRSSHPCS